MRGITWLASAGQSDAKRPQSGKSERDFPLASLPLPLCSHPLLLPRQLGSPYFTVVAARPRVMDVQILHALVRDHTRDVVLEIVASHDVSIYHHRSPIVSTK